MSNFQARLALPQPKNPSGSDSYPQHAAHRHSTEAQHQSPHGRHAGHSPISRFLSWEGKPGADTKASLPKVTLPSFREAFPEHLFPMLPYGASNTTLCGKPPSTPQFNEVHGSRPSDSFTFSPWALQSVDDEHSGWSSGSSPVTESQRSPIRWIGMNELSTNSDGDPSDSEFSNETLHTSDHDLASRADNPWERYTAEEVDKDGARYYQCLWHVKGSTCDYQTESKQAMKRHVQNTHMGIRSHVCSQCNKGFSQKSALTVHEAVHTGVRSKLCEYCQEAFSDPARLHRHKKLAHNHRPKPRRKRIARVPMRLDAMSKF